MNQERGMIDEVIPPDRDRMGIVWSDLPDRFQDGPSIGRFIDVWRSLGEVSDNTARRPVGPDR